MKTKQIKEEKAQICKSNYEEFCQFWIKARNITDEDGDNILEWDKSNIANFCFTEGLTIGKQQARTELTKEFLDKFEKVEGFFDKGMRLRVLEGRNKDREIRLGEIIKDFKYYILKEF